VTTRAWGCVRAATLKLILCPQMLTARTLLFAIVLLSLSVPGHAQCEPWCSEPCTVLNGNVELECPDCKPGTHGCYPGAEGYSSWEERNVQFHGSNSATTYQGGNPPNEEETLYPGCDTLRCKRIRQKQRIARERRGQAQTLAPPPASPRHPRTARARGSISKTKSSVEVKFLAPRHDGSTAGGEPVKCELQRLTFAEVVEMTPEQRMAVFEQPTVITGMIDDWVAHRNWTDPRLFAKRFGHHRVLAKRAAFGWARAAEEGIAVDQGASVSLAELIQRTESEHIIVLDEMGKGEREEDLLQDLESEYTRPEIFEGATQCRVFSFGGGHRGVQMMQHGAAWLGMVSGAKLWHVAAPHLPRPSNRECENGGRIEHQVAKKEGVEHCLLLPGEVIWVPHNWWHATCNLDPYTIGVGGQLWLPGQQDNFRLRSERKPIQWQPSYESEVDEPDVPLPDKIEPVIFDHEAVMAEEAQDDAEQQVVHVDAMGGQASTDRGMGGGMGGMGMGGGMSGTVGGGRGNGLMTLDEARAAGVNVPAEIHAWAQVPEHERKIDPNSVGPGMTGAPKGNGFKLPGAYKKPGCDLWRMDVRTHELTRELLDEAEWPFIIDGLTSNWTILSGWGRDKILAQHGQDPFHLHDTYNRSLSELLVIDGQYHMGHAVYPSHACYSDPWRPYSPFLFDQISDGAYHVPPYFQPMSTFQMGIGTGQGVGVPPENHPSSWFAAVVGRKRWLLHPDSEKEPREMMARRHFDKSKQCHPTGKTESTLDCVQEAGDVMWIPNYWWHETCGIDDFSAGIGGITYKGCCADMDNSVPPDANCKRGDSGGYAIRDIPYCHKHACGTL